MGIKNVEELRDYLSETLEKINSGDTTPAAANASANVAGKILSSVKLELEHNKMAGTNPDIGFLKNFNKGIKKLGHDKLTGEIK